MAVVKANAYGHGVTEVVKSLNSLEDKKPEYYAVATADEGAEVRKLKVKQPILVFEPISAAEAETAIKNSLTASVFNKLHLKILLDAKNRLNIKKKIPVHVKIDTGMNRLGIKYFEAVDFVKLLSANPNFIIDGVYTHFATSDEKDKEFANLQLKRFNDIVAQLNESGINYGMVHAANSGAILDMPEAYFDMVRPGISLYGYYPSLETSESIKLKPVMSVYSHIASVKEIDKGDSVSYGRRFTASKRTQIATVPIGYADGYRRSLTNKSKAIIKGKFYPQIGTVTMDRIMFDIDDSKIKHGDKITLLGKEKGAEITAWDWSSWLNTIPYEITCGISQRVPRVYKK